MTEGQVPSQLGDALLHHPDVFLDLRQEDGSLDARDQETGEPLGVDIRGEGASSLGARQGRGQALAPALEPISQALTESLMGIGELHGEVADGAAADTVSGALGRQDLVEEGLYLAERVPPMIPEDGGQGSRLESLEQPIEDRVTEILLGAEVVIEITLSGTTLPEDVGERSPMVPPNCHEPGGHLQDLLLDGGRAHSSVPTGRYASAASGACQAPSRTSTRHQTDRLFRRDCLTGVEPAA